MAAVDSTSTISAAYSPVWDEAVFRILQAGLSGELFQPGDSGYDSARQLWNGAVDKHPALIIRCATAQDVVRRLILVAGTVCLCRCKRWSQRSWLGLE